MAKLKKPINDFNKIGCFGIGVYKPKTSENIGTLIRSAKNFGADYVFTIGKRYKKQCSDVGLSGVIPIFNFETVTEFLKSIPPCEKITAIELVDNSIKLKEYKHRNTGCYILGSEDGGLPNEILNNDRFEFVEIEGGKSLNVAVAGSIVLYDRIIKSPKA